jgi:WhiB family redox-sensing transcriptional regulator
MTVAPDTDAWMRDALCIEYPDLAWFPKQGESAVPAKEVCARCLVQAECLTFAVSGEFLDGVFGGTSGSERRRMRKGGVTLDAALLASESRMQRERRLYGGSLGDEDNDFDV